MGQLRGRGDKRVTIEDAGTFGYNEFITIYLNTYNYSLFSLE